VSCRNTSLALVGGLSTNRRWMERVRERLALP